ncbi:MAG: hypothetical protein LC799_30345 [Actinobacteria bacterium]|nr:hypothetical protein [Actinomycetota bacterium]
MTAREAHRMTTLNRPSLVLAVGSTAAVAAAAATGHAFGPPELVGAFAVAGTIGVLNARSRPQARPHVLSPSPEGSSGVAMISAPRARSLAAHPARHSDAA